MQQRHTSCAGAALYISASVKARSPPVLAASSASGGVDGLANKCRDDWNLVRVPYSESTCSCKVPLQVPLKVSYTLHSRCFQSALWLCLFYVWFWCVLTKFRRHITRGLISLASRLGIQSRLIVEPMFALRVNVVNQNPKNQNTTLKCQQIIVMSMQPKINLSVWSAPPSPSATGGSELGAGLNLTKSVVTYILQTTWFSQSA